jgi:outer membrane protein assembly factor BamB
MAFDQLLYSPKPYQQGRYFNQDFAQASAGKILVRGRPGKVVRINTEKATGDQPQGIWENSDFARTTAMAVAHDAVLVVGQLASGESEKPGEMVLAGLDSESGKARWSMPLPGAPLAWGLAVDREGRILVTLQDGRLLCFSAKTGK